MSSIEQFSIVAHPLTCMQEREESNVCEGCVDVSGLEHYFHNGGCPEGRHVSDFCNL